MKFRRAKMVACVSAIIMLVLLWLYVIANLNEFQLSFMIVGVLFVTMIVVYVTVMLGIIACELSSAKGI